MNRNMFGLFAMALLLNPDEAGSNEQQSPVETPITPIAKGDNVIWNDKETEEEYFGTVESIENGVAAIKDQEGQDYKVPIVDLEKSETSYQIIAELPIDPSNPESAKVAFTNKTYKKGRKATEAFLTGFSFAVPRYASVDALREHLNFVLKKQNKHKEQDATNGLTADDILLDNYHSMSDGKLRTKIKNEQTAEIIKLGGKETITPAGAIEWSKKHESNKQLFTPEQALAWIPGIRETSGIAKIKGAAVRVNELKAKHQAAGTNPMADPEFLRLLGELAMAAA